MALSGTRMPAMISDMGFCLLRWGSLRVGVNWHAVVADRGWWRPSLFGGDLHRRKSQRFRYARAISRVRFRAVGDVALLDLDARVAHGARRVLEQHLLLRRRHLAKQDAGLLVVVIVDAMIPMRRRTRPFQRRLGEPRVMVDPHALAVGPV